MSTLTAVVLAVATVAAGRLLGWIGQCNGPTGAHCNASVTPGPVSFQK